MSCCGQKPSGTSKAFTALLDKAMELEEAGREKEAEIILASMAHYFEERASKEEAAKKTGE